MRRYLWPMEPEPLFSWNERLDATNVKFSDAWLAQIAKSTHDFSAAYAGQFTSHRASERLFPSIAHIEPQDIGVDASLQWRAR